MTLTSDGKLPVFARRFYRPVHSRSKSVTFRMIRLNPRAQEVWSERTAHLANFQSTLYENVDTNLLFGGWLSSASTPSLHLPWNSSYHDNAIEWNHWAASIKSMTKGDSNRYLNHILDGSSGTICLNPFSVFASGRNIFPCLIYGNMTRDLKDNTLPWPEFEIPYEYFPVPGFADYMILGIVAYLTLWCLQYPDCFLSPASSCNSTAMIMENGVLSMQKSMECIDTLCSSLVDPTIDSDIGGVGVSLSSLLCLIVRTLKLQAGDGGIPHAHFHVNPGWDCSTYWGSLQPQAPEPHKEQHYDELPHPNASQEYGRFP